MADSPKTGNQEFGDLLREAREDRGMSRRDLAEATGLSYPYISQLETGYRLPSPSAIQTLSRVLLVSLDAIFATITSGEPPPAPRRRTAPGPPGWVQNPAYAPSPSAGSSGGAGVAAGAGAAGPSSPTPPSRPVPPSNAALGQFAMASPLDASPASADSTDDVVPAVMDLLLRLPADDRMHALAQIQQRVVTSVVDEAARKTRRS